MRAFVGVAVAAMATVRAAAATPYQVAPTAIDFGAVDIQGPPAVRTVTLTNTSLVTISVGAVSCSGATAFTLSATPAIHLAVGASETVTVTYTPAAEQPETSSLVFPIGTTRVTVPLAGRGIDRHIAITAPTFPDTYRNPGELAPVRSVMIANTGEASLAITSVTLDGAPMWQLVDGAPTEVPGGASCAVSVRFTPSVIGAAPAGKLTITDDDSAQPVVAIELDGNGIAREVALGPPVIDLGYTAVGAPIDAPLTITNLDATSFEIEALTIGDPAFTVTTLDGEPTSHLPLPVDTSMPLDVRFVASTSGDYQTTASLFLDQDPQAQTSVVLVAHAEYIDVQGGGGCSAGGDAGLGAVGLALLLLLRRKRWALLAMPAVASADPPRNIAISIFDPTPATLGSNFQLVGPDIAGRGNVVASALVTFASNPLVLATPQANDVVVSDRTTLVVGGAYAVNDTLELGLHMPLMIQNGQVADPTMEAGASSIPGDARGNLTLHGKARIMPGLGALATLELPTATENRFAGSGKVSARLLAVSAFPVAWGVSTTLDFGAVLRGDSQFGNITERNGAAWGAGATFTLERDFTITAELFGELVPGGRRDAMNQAGLLATSEVLGGVHYQLDPMLQLGVAVGRGVIDGPGAPTLRGVVTLAYAQRVVTPRTPPPPKRPDDADRDGVPDVRDQCPHVAEDWDGFADEDGCPDRDNDGDGISDAQDKCPMQPEDKDGFDDDDGCPDPDNDHDGIPDVRDACPLQAETINGVTDDDGCPDAGEPAAVVDGDRIELLAPVKFIGTRITEGQGVLVQVGALLRAHDDITQLRIVVYAPDINIAYQRADEVRDALVHAGVSGDRLDARGAGGDESLDLLAVH
jgi:MYXO-CTERM domain-containing protein